MFVFPVISVIAILSSSSNGLETKIEWKLGSQYPESKLLDPGVQQDLYCSVNTTKPSSSILLLCPLQPGICMHDCNRTNEISCTKIKNQETIIYHYSFKVFKNFEGSWTCQFKTQISRSLRLTVTNKPYIKSFHMTPNPVWKGASLNLSCEVMPTSSVINIQIQRIVEENSIPSISNSFSYRINEWTEGITINQATPGVDDQMLCTVISENGPVTSEKLRTNIYYYPENLTLTSSPTETRYEVGSSISFQCSYDKGNPRPQLNIFHERFGKRATKMVETNIILTKYDNKAQFYCKVEPISGRQTNLKSNTIKIIVNYPPEKMELTEEPEDQLVESQTKRFVCLTKGHSEPPSQIEWSLTDGLGRKIQKPEAAVILENEAIENGLPSSLLKSTVRVVMLRNYNGYRITCSIIYQEKKHLTQTKTIKVVFSPNYVSLNSNPLGAIQEGKTVVLTCSTGSANPPSKIQWSKTEPGKRPEDITSHSNKDIAPSNYSGTALYSSLSIHGISRQNHGTIYRCMISHAYMSSEIIKEYFLNVLFPPVVQVFSFPKQIEEGEKIHLQCQTSGGNPSSIFQYNFQWGFCPVNISYQPPLNSGMDNKPSPEIRQSCSQLPDRFSFHQNPILNISSVTGKDRGWYSCHIRSPGGLAFGYLFLDVQYPPILTHQTPNRIYAKRSSNILFNVQLSSNPISVNIQWYFKPNYKITTKSFESENNHLNMQSLPGLKQKLNIGPYGRIKFSLLDNYTIHFSISSLVTSDYGEYFCEVSNTIGRKSIEFQLYPSDDISISESNIRLQFNGRKVTVFYVPPSNGHFTHLMLRICLIQEGDKCKDMQITDPQSGQAMITLPQSPSLYSYRLLVYNGSTLLHMTNMIQKDMAPAHWVEMSMEMMIAVIIGVVGILVLLFVALLTLILLKCRRKKPKDNYLENNSVATTNSHQRRQDYMLLNSPPNTSLLKNGCHCFSNYPIELRSDNGSDHSVPSQNIYQPMMMRRKVRDNGEMSSVHSGGSCHSPDVVLTERTSISSATNPMVNGTPYPYHLGNGSTKVTLLSGRLHPFEGGQRQDANMPEEYLIPQEMLFAAVDDGINLSQARIIPIPKNLGPDYPVYFQMTNQIAPKPYEMPMPTHYTSAMPQLECNNQNSRESSSTANTDSNQDSGTHDLSAVETRNEDIVKSQPNH